MATLLDRSTQKARKAHSCTWCGQEITPGESYTRTRFIFEGEHKVNKFHPECDEAAHVAARNEGGEFEFEPGENERPVMRVTP